MISLSLIKNASGAAKYYAKEDNYYLSEVDAKEASLWWGEGASRLGLSGKVEEKELQKLLEGNLSNGVTIGLQKDGTIKHRAGYDICFHAPKSVSILALDGGDKRFYNAHIEAVKETLKFIERDCAQARIHRNGQVSFENTKNLAVALVRHTASRKLDPHLHTHALVMNFTQRQDRLWRALASNKTKNKDHINGFTERVHSNQIYYGLIYKSALASKVQELGCEIEIAGKHSLWEIKGVPQEARDVMSKRRLQIKERIDKLNYPSLKATDVIALDTRERKPKKMNLAEIKQTWKKELASVGFSSKEFIAELDKNIELKIKNAGEKSLGTSSPPENAKQAITDAISYLSQYNLKLDYSKIIAQALEFSIGKATHVDMVRSLSEAIKNNQLIPLNKSESLFVTKELIETEKSIMDLVAESRNANATVIQKDDNSKNKIIDSGAASEDKSAAIKVLQSNSRLNLIEHSSIDSTELNSTILKLAESSGKTVRILSPNRMMSNDINENIKRKPSNLWQWLVSLGKPEIGECIAGFKHKYQEEIDLPLLRLRQGRDVIVVNSAEIIGCSDIKALLELTQKTNAKVIFLQDLNARSSFSASNPMQTLKQAGIETFKINTEMDKANKCTVELATIKDNDERIKQLARIYALKDEKERNNTTVFLGNKEQLKHTNVTVREELKKLGKLSGIEHSIQVLTPIYLSEPESTIAHIYQQNMVIRFYDVNHKYQDWNIESVDKEKNTLRLVQGNRRLLLNPKKYNQDQEARYVIFKKEYLQLAKGDRLIATANMSELGIKNATTLIVQEIDEKRVELLSNSKVI